jgi:asparagine synthase (glutamine-hydrolysing)
MCGILGYFSSKKSKKDIFINALKGIAHRGPDFMNWTNHDFLGIKGYLGHVRLAIIGLDNASNQPFKFNELQIVFNGEIYNYKDIKFQLETLGYTFKTNSDTEVLLKAYHAWGLDCLPRLNGMFAFAVFDQKKKSILLCRDRFGVKPLYYKIKNGELIFSSELKSIIQLSDLEVKQDNAAIENFLLRGWMSGNDTGIIDAHQLEPGSSLNINLLTFEIHQEKFWNLHNEIANTDIENYNINELLDDSIRLRLTSDVPVGCFLSGGVDSSLVASVAARYSPARLKTFNIKFLDPRFDESESAKFVSKLLNTEHHEFVFHPKDAISKVNKLIENTDFLFNDWSTLPMLMLSEKVSSEVKVVLSGDGGDEFFFGYAKYFQLLNLKEYSHITSHIFKYAAKFFNQSKFAYFKRLTYSLDYRASLQSAANAEMLINELAQFHGEIINDVLFNSYQKKFYSSDEKGPKDFSKMMQLADVNGYLRNNILPKVDRSTMAYGLEAREPLLDYRLLLYTMSVPQRKLGISAPGKLPLIEKLQNELPTYRVGAKRGFSVPMRDWMRNELREFVRDNIAAQKFRSSQDILSLTNIDYYIDNFFKNNIGNPRFIWGIVLYSCWLQRWNLSD